MKDGWFCVQVLWKTGEVQSVWVKSEALAWEVLNAIMEKDDFNKVKLFPEEDYEKNTKR